MWMWRKSQYRNKQLVEIVEVLWHAGKFGVVAQLARASDLHSEGWDIVHPRLHPRGMGLLGLVTAPAMRTSDDFEYRILHKMVP